MRKLILLVVLIIIPFVILGCQTTQEEEFRKGFPIMKVDVINIKGYEDYPFDLKVLVHNVLGYDVKNVDVSVLGLDETYVELFSYKESIDEPIIKGRSELLKNGEKAVVDFEGTVMNLPEGAEEDIENPYRIYVEYDSKVVLSRMVCIPPDDKTTPYPGIVDEECKVEQGQKKRQKIPLKRGETKLFGQGAPIGFSNVDIRFREQNVELIFEISNKKDGTVGTIILDSASLGGKPLTCNFKTEINKNSIEFDPKKKEITLICNGVVRRDSVPYTTPLVIELSYDYEFSVQKELVMSE